MTKAQVDSNGKWQCLEVLGDGRPCLKLLGIWVEGVLTIIEGDETFVIEGKVQRTCGRGTGVRGEVERALYLRHARVMHEMDTRNVEVLPAKERHERTVG